MSSSRATRKRPPPPQPHLRALQAEAPAAPRTVCHALGVGVALADAVAIVEGLGGAVHALGTAAHLREGGGGASAASAGATRCTPPASPATASYPPTLTNGSARRRGKPRPLGPAPRQAALCPGARNTSRAAARPPPHRTRAHRLVVADSLSPRSPSTCARGRGACHLPALAPSRPCSWEHHKRRARARARPANNSRD